MAWEVDDLQEAIAELRERGVIFEEYNVPGLKTVNGIAEVEGNYPSKGGAGEKAAWFNRSYVITGMRMLAVTLDKRCARQVGVLATCRCSVRHLAVR